MNIFDVGIFLVLIMFIIVGFKNGVIKELAGLIGIIIVFYLSYILKSYIGNIFCLIFPFFNFIGSIQGLTTINILLYQAIAFLLVFSILLSVYAIVLKVSKFLQKIVNITIILWLPSKILGGVVGFISGIICLYVVLLLLVIPIGNQVIYNDSVLVNKIIYNTPIISSSTNKFTSTVMEVNSLKNRVNNKEISINDTNLEILDIMLNNKVTNKKTVEKLVNLHKLDNINNIERVLNKY